jgi:hypothetical protein
VPSSEVRAENRQRLNEYSIERFNGYGDWFYFIHIDPVVRFWHSLGFVVGTSLYISAIVAFSWWSIPLALGGLFFFYFLGLISHFYYDGGLAKSDVGHWHESTPLVIRIILTSITGRYNGQLEDFIRRYPFTVDAYGLERIGHAGEANSESA